MGTYPGHYGTFSYIIQSNDHSFISSKRSLCNDYNVFISVEMLHKKKREAIQLSSSINDIKKKIDEVLCECVHTIILH